MCVSDCCLTDWLSEVVSFSWLNVSSRADTRLCRVHFSRVSNVEQSIKVVSKEFATKAVDFGELFGLERVANENWWLRVKYAEGNRGFVSRCVRGERCKNISPQNYRFLKNYCWFCQYKMEKTLRCITLGLPDRSYPKISVIGIL